MDINHVRYSLDAVQPGSKVRDGGGCVHACPCSDKIKLFASCNSEIYEKQLLCCTANNCKCVLLSLMHRNQ